MADNVHGKKTHNHTKNGDNTFETVRQILQLPETTSISCIEKGDRNRDQVDQLGIICLPPGCRGLRSLYLRREDDSFGFTLRHFILYSPEALSSYNESDTSSTLSEPLETIFVKDIIRNGPAERSGLKTGDRLVAVNGVNLNNYNYAQVVQMIKNGPDYMHLLVISKEDDVLQKYYPNTVYCPETNQKPDVRQLQKKHRRSSDTVIRSNWDQNFNIKTPLPYKTDNDPVYSIIKDDDQHIYSEVIPRPRRHFDQDQRIRRKSECSRDFDDHSSLSSMRINNKNMSILNSIGCRLSLDAGSTLNDRCRESSSSMVDSTSDCKDNYCSNSIDSISTLTHYDVDDSQRMSRLKRDFERKKEFLRQLPIQNVSMPWPVSSSVNNSHENVLIAPKEFYGRPHKFQKESLIWPPKLSTVTPELSDENQNSKVGQIQQKVQSHDEEFLKKSDCDNSNKQSVHLPNAHYVSKITHQFEHVNENGSMSDKTDFYRSELARLSQRRPITNIVATKKHEFETLLTSQSQSEKDTLSYRLSQSSESNDSCQNVNDQSDISNSNISGNRMVIIGNKNLHCEPPVVSQRILNVADESKTVDNMDCSAAISLTKEIFKEDFLKYKDLNTNHDLVPNHQYSIQQSENQQRLTPIISITPVSNSSTSDFSNAQVNRLPAQRPNFLALKNPIRISPTSNDSGQVTPEDDSISSTVSNNDSNIPIVVRRNKNSNQNEDRVTRRISYLKATWGDRINLDSDLELSDCEYSPKSSKKSTYRCWRPPLFLNDIQQLKKIFEDIASASSGSSTKILTKDKEFNELVAREGHLQCKVLGFDGKKASGRSWKEVWVILQGPFLCFYKDRHYQTPMGLNEMESGTNSNSSSSNSVQSYSQIDMRYSAVSVADDYKKSKNVIRIATSKPCRTELLLQTDTAADMADWIRSFDEQVVTTIKQDDKKTQQITENNRLKISPFRTRSPSGQSPVSKSRKSSDILTISSSEQQQQQQVSSPKPKNWRNRMVKQFRKIQHSASSPNSPTTNTTAASIVEGSFGLPLELCVSSSGSEFVPKLMEICTDLVEKKGLEVKGIYRVPGNNAAVTFLTECVNKGLDNFNLQDSRWNDMNVVGSLLKSFLRKLPDSLLTIDLYSAFIEADKIDDHYERLIRIRKLIHELPIHNYETLKFLIRHLQKVVEHSDINKMEARNIAIVFGPTLVRDVDDNMVTMVTDMSHQCRIVESLILYADWFFSGEDNFNIPPSPVLSSSISEPDTTSIENHNLLLENISKVENFKNDNHKKDIVSSILSAANRKMQRKSRKTSGSELKSDSMNSVNNSCSSTELLDSCCNTSLSDSSILPKNKDNDGLSVSGGSSSTSSSNNSAKNLPSSDASKGLIVTYANLSATTQERIRKFEQETRAQLSRQRVLNLRDNKFEIDNQNNSKTNDNSIINKNDLNSIRNCHKSRNVIIDNNKSLHVVTTDECDNAAKKTLSDINKSVQYPANITLKNMLDESSFLKRVKTAITSDTKLINQKSGSLDSLNNVSLADYKRSSLELSDEGSDLVQHITTTFDNKLKSIRVPSKLKCVNQDELPDSHKKLMTVNHCCNNEKSVNANAVAHQLPPNASPKLFRNPSLHKNFEDTINSMREKLSKDETKVPDKNLLNNSAPVDKLQITNTKVRRSESLNKGATSLFSAIRIRRSESLNKSDKVFEKLIKFDNLIQMKSKKIAIGGGTGIGTNIVTSKNRKRTGSKSIKRRHTVGGTKDFDNIQWLDKNQKQKTVKNEIDCDYCYPDENCDLNNIDKGMRSSSPDLSNSKQQSIGNNASMTTTEATSKFLYDVQDDLIALLKQHFSKPISSDRTPIKIA